MRRTALDALCGEYLIGTLRGAARKRFERAVREEPLVAQRLRHWETNFSPRYARIIETRPSPQVWRRLESTLGLARYRAPWFQRAGFWRVWAVTATVALVFVASLPFVKKLELDVAQLAQLTGKDPAVATVSAHRSADGKLLMLHASRPTIAGPAQSYELWLLTPEGGVISLAVLGSLDARFEVPEAHRSLLRTGAQLAISVEPAGGSPSGKPTGPVILVGPIKT